VCADGASGHQTKAHEHARDTLEFFDSRHSRDSIDGSGQMLISNVRYDWDFDNAFWDSEEEQMVYGDYRTYPMADDVVGHEITHGFTDHESQLFYYYQSGAINESLSDLWGEFVDLTNGAGTDTAGTRWLLGENVSPGGAIRDMENPPTYGDPDKMTSPNYVKGGCYDLYDTESYCDYGWVHYNSGVNNKAVFLMTDGGTFNGHTVTSLGIDKVADIYYEAAANLLTSGSDYGDLYNAVYQACLNLVGTGGITSPNCLEVHDAV